MATSQPIPNAAFNASPVQSTTVQSIAANPGLTPGNIFGSGNSQLSLANGMTAGVGVNGTSDSPYSNPPLQLTSPTGAAVNPYGGDPNWPIQRVGVMRNIPGSLGGNPSGNSGSDVSYLYFIYNPNQIVASFTTNISSIPPMYLYGTDTSSLVNGGSNAISPANGSLSALSSSNASVPNLTSSQQVSWSLIFDRTYDMMYDTNPDENRGVLKDTAALYALMGTFDNSGAVPISTPVQVVFGQTGGQNAFGQAAPGQLWGFTGYISSVNITYGIFRHNMIPSRCEIDLTMTCTYVAAQAPSSTGVGTSYLPPTSSGPGGGGTPLLQQTTAGPPVVSTIPQTALFNT